MCSRVPQHIYAKLSIAVKYLQICCQSRDQFRRVWDVFRRYWTKSTKLVSKLDSCLLCWRQGTNVIHLRKWSRIYGSQWLHLLEWHTLATLRFGHWLEYSGWKLSQVVVQNLVGNKGGSELHKTCAVIPVVLELFIDDLLPEVTVPSSLVKTTVNIWS